MTSPPPAPQPFRVAVLPCWKNHGHQHEYDTLLRAAGADFTVLEESREALDALFSSLDDFDLLLAPPLFHYDQGRERDPDWRRPYDFASYAPILRGWLARGGNFLVTDANYAVGLSWLSALDPALALRAVESCGANGARPVDALDPLMAFPARAETAATFAHLVPEREEAWEVLARCAHGHPTLLAARIGDGLVVLDNLRAEAVDGLLRNLRARQSLRRFGLSVARCGARPFAADRVECRTDLDLVNLRDTSFSGDFVLSATPVVRQETPRGEMLSLAPVEEVVPDPFAQTFPLSIPPGGRVPVRLAAAPFGGKAEVRLDLVADGAARTIAGARMRFQRPGEEGLLAVPPSVFVAGQDYVVGILAVDECVVGVEVGGRIFWDACCGVRRTSSPIHLVRLPRERLHGAGEYTVVMRPVQDRQPYHVFFGDEERHRFAFRIPAEGNSFRIVALGDTHNLVDEAVAAGEACGTLPDLLVLAGDIADDGGRASNFETIYRVAGRLTHGAVPCVYAHGNHEACGTAAESFDRLAPTDGGRTYFAFRLGPLAGIVLDTGAMEAPSAENSSRDVVGCHAMRLEQGEWLDGVLASDAWREATYRILIAHIPFFSGGEFTASLEREVYADWTEKLRAAHLDLALTGHTHRAFVETPDAPRPGGIPPCLHICVTERREGKPVLFSCSDITLSPDGPGIAFVRSDSSITHWKEIPT